ncbi:MAG: hypothetical protein C4329_13355 [Chitinophagaceae bacterium]
MLFALTGRPSERHLTHFWSLAVEEQFYLIWPLVVFYIKDRRKLVTLLWRTIVVVTLIRFAVCFYATDLASYHCNTFCRIDSIAFGCLIGCGYRFLALKQ